MKATGIIRRIDDLGRIVIPKEIRRNLGIREGEPLEIFVHEGCVCLKKYIPNELEKVSDVFKELADFAEDEGGLRMRTKVSELQAEVEERLKEIFV
mgnify:CR=1 FL=1